MAMAMTDTKSPRDPGQPESTPKKDHSGIHDQTNILTGSRLIIVFTALSSALLVGHMDQNAVGVVLPTIGRDLNSSSTIVWAGTAAFISNTSFQVLYGRLSDIVGRKVILISMLGLLSVGDLLCSLARTGPQLYAFRAISGLANGGIFATVMMIVSDITTLERRGKYQGILGACVGLGSAVGPFIAAGLTSRYTWRATFYFLSPLAAIICVLLFFLLPKQTIPPEPASAKLKKIDWAGLVLSCSGTITLLIPVSGIGTQFSTSSPMVIAMLTVGGLLLVAFLINEWKFARLPMLPLRLWKTTSLAAMFIQNFLIGLIYFSALFYLPIYFQTSRGLTPLNSAALLTGMVLPQALASAASGQYMSRMGRYGEVIWAGYVSWTIGIGLHMLFSRNVNLGVIVAALCLQGIGVGFIFQPTLVATQAHTAKEDRAVAISARNFIRALGGATGLAIASAIFSNVLVNSLPHDLPLRLHTKISESVFEVPDLSGLALSQQDAVRDAYVKAAKGVFHLWMGAISTCLLLMLCIKDKGIKRDEEKEQELRQVEDTEAAVGHDDGVLQAQGELADKSRR